MADLDRYRCHWHRMHTCARLTRDRICADCTRGRHDDDPYAHRDPGDWEPHDRSEDP